MSNPSKDIFVAQVDSPADPAFDVAAPNYQAAVAKYGTSRSLADLAAVPVLEGQQPLLYRLRAINTEARATMLGLTSESVRLLFAARLGVVGVLTGPYQINGETVNGGVEETLPTEPKLRWPMLSVEGCDRLAELGGGQLLDELGEVVTTRSTAHPRALRPFRQPLGSGGSR